MITKKKIILIGSVLVLSVLVYIFSPKIDNYFKWKRAAEAAGGFSYQIGLVGAVITPCTLTPPPVVACVGGTLCYIKDQASCLMYSDVSGTPAGGMGSNAIFLNTAIAQAGLTQGGQLIAGGMSPSLMDSGVLASTGGCFGCVAKASPKEKLKKWIYDFIIAGNKDN